MSKKLFFILLSFLILAGCSSNPKTSDSATSSATGGTSEQTAAKVAATKEVEVDSEIKKNEKADPKIVSELETAIKSQNDAVIAKTASQVLIQNPNDVLALNALAMTNYKNGRFEAAKYLLNKAMSLNSEKAELHSNLGLVLLAQNEKRDAIQSFRKALQIDSRNAVAAANLGSIFIQEKDFSKALISLEVAYNRGLKDPKVLNNYAIALFANGKQTEAGSIWARLAKDHPQFREGLVNHIGYLVEHEKKYKEGIEFINRIKFVGVPAEIRGRVNSLETKAKNGLEQVQ